jgi:hypothetical protein
MDGIFESSRRCEAGVRCSGTQLPHVIINFLITLQRLSRLADGQAARTRRTPRPLEMPLLLMELPTYAHALRPLHLAA